MSIAERLPTHCMLHWRRFAFLVAGLLLLVVFVDYATSGAITVEGVHFKDITVEKPIARPANEKNPLIEAMRKLKENPNDESLIAERDLVIRKMQEKMSYALLPSPFTSPIIPMVITLPFNVRSIRPDNSEFEFSIPFTSRPWDRLKPVYLWADDCFAELSFDKTPQITRGDECKSVVTLSGVDAKVSGILSDVGGALMLKLKRERMIGYDAACVLAGIACYLLFLMLHPTWASLRQSHYVLALSALFIGSMFSYTKERWVAFYYSMHDLKSIFTFLATGLCIFLAALASWYWIPSRKLHGYAAGGLARIMRIPARRWAYVFSLIFFALAVILAHVVFDATPHVADTHVQYVMAKIFASGHITGPAHELPDFFDFQFTVNKDKFYGHYFPGHAMLLAVGHLIQMPWIINPLFGALTVYMTFLLGRELADEKTGLLAAFLMLISPHTLFMSAEYMSHGTCIFFLTAFCYCYLRLMNTRSLRYALLAGACLGYALLNRPQTAVPFALPIALHALCIFAIAPRDWCKPFLAAGAAFSIFVGMLLYYNYATSGSPWLTPYDVTQPAESGFMAGFLEPERWSYIKMDLKRALAHITNLHVDLMGWPTSPFIFLLLLYLFRMQPRYSALLLSTLFASFVSLIFFNPFSTNVFPSRYVYEETAILVVLIACGMVRLPLMAKRFCGLSEKLAATSLAITLAVCIACAWPYRVQELYRMYADNFWEGNNAYTRMIVNSVEKPAVVLMRNYFEYRLNFYLREPGWTEDVIFAQDLGAYNKTLMKYYPDRHIYFVEGTRIQKLR